MVTTEWHWEEGNKYAVEGIKTSLLLNGAAAIALMTFASTHDPSSGMKCALFLFALGAIFSAIAFMGAYYAQLHYGNAEFPGNVDKNRDWRKGQRINVTPATGQVIAILPSSCLTSEKDAGALKAISDRYSITKIAKIRPYEFKSCRVDIDVVWLKPHRNRLESPIDPQTDRCCT